MHCIASFTLSSSFVSFLRIVPFAQLSKSYFFTRTTVDLCNFITEIDEVKVPNTHKNGASSDAREREREKARERESEREKGR